MKKPPPQRTFPAWSLWLGLGAAGLLGASLFVLSRRDPAADPSAAPRIAPAAAENRVGRLPMPTDFKSTAPLLPAAKVPSTRSPEAIAWLEDLGAKNSAQAISWALTEADPERRAELIQAALRGWASIDCEAAAQWALHQSYAELGQAFSAVFNGAKKLPEKAVGLAQRLVKEDPAHAGDYGSYLIFALGSTGEYSRAAAYAAQSSAENQTELLTSAYHHWSLAEPEVAARMALRLTEPGQQRAAFQAALGGWAQSDPEKLTKTALNFPEGEDRKLALTIGLRSWIEKNPSAAAEWISQNKFTPEMEAALEE